MNAKFFNLMMVALVVMQPMFSYASTRYKKNEKTNETVAAPVDSLPKSPQNQEGDLTRQKGTVCLVVSGDGETSDDATKNALRSAIEQAFGTFVSAKTEVVNDELVKDEIVSVATGNVQGYKVLSKTEKGSLVEVTVEAVVSIGKLVEYARSKGMEVELSGATFLMNKRLRELNRRNTEIALEHLKKEIDAIALNGLSDYKIIVGNPQERPGNKTAIPMTIERVRNKNYDNLITVFNNTMHSLIMSYEEVKEYTNAEALYFNTSIHPEVKEQLANIVVGPLRGGEKSGLFSCSLDQGTNRMFFSFDYVAKLEDYCASFGFEIIDNLGNSYSISSMDSRSVIWNDERIKTIEDNNYYPELFDETRKKMRVEIEMDNKDLEKLQKFEIKSRQLDEWVVSRCAQTRRRMKNSFWVSGSVTNQNAILDGNLLSYAFFSLEETPTLQITIYNYYSKKKNIKITILNGAQDSKSDYYDFARIADYQIVDLDGKEIISGCLKDTPEPQTISTDFLDNNSGEFNLKNDIDKDHAEFKIEILSVYRGRRYKNIAITEIY